MWFYSFLNLTFTDFTFAINIINEKQDSIIFHSVLFTLLWEYFMNFLFGPFLWTHGVWPGGLMVNRQLGEVPGHSPQFPPSIPDVMQTVKVDGVWYDRGCCEYTRACLLLFKGNSLENCLKPLWAGKNQRLECIRHTEAYIKC